MRIAGIAGLVALFCLFSGAAPAEERFSTIPLDPTDLGCRPLPRDVIARIREARARLEATGGLVAAQGGPRPSFIWPLRQRAPFEHPGAWATVRFVDHDERFPGFLLDYRGGDRTYDLEEGYNHQGTDILVWPFGWVKTLLGQVEVAAAAAGTILASADGNFDQECGLDLGEDREPNYVAIAHQDGSTAIYAHLGRGSVTKKKVGGTVEQGEVLGTVASSGQSSYAHLHFEVWDRDDQLVDPFSGPGNRLNAESWWAEQPPYYETRPLALMSHTAEPLPVGCNYAERTLYSDRFAPGDQIVFTAWLRDIRNGRKYKYLVLDPDGHPVASGRYRHREGHWAIYRLVHGLTLPARASLGVWTLRAKFAGRTLEHRFQVGDFAPLAAVRSVRPNHLRAGDGRKIRLTGFGFSRGLVVDVLAPNRLEKEVRIRGTRIRARRVVLRVNASESAEPGPRDLLLTWPDYRQILLPAALEVRE